MLGRILSVATNKIHTLPVLVLMPHSRCNCRCVMCDIWKANQQKNEISSDELKKHLGGFQKLNVRSVALSGGEALMHSNLWKFCDLLHSIGVKISLLSTGMTIKQHAADIVQHCDDVIVSLDGDAAIHNEIRNVPAAFERLEEGVRELRRNRPGYRITGRTVIQKRNFRHFNAIVKTAKDIGLDQISFLAADVSSEAFNRKDPWKDERISDVALNPDEASELERIIMDASEHQKANFDSGFIAEDRQKLLKMVQHYRALAGIEKFPGKKCNAPWVSAVIDSTSNVMPCFFHPPYGNLGNGTFDEVINSREAISFRKKLDVQKDPICQRCVCSLHLPVWQSIKIQSSARVD